MSPEREAEIIARAGELYEVFVSRPWYVKVWDRVRAECLYRLAVLRGR